MSSAKKDRSGVFNGVALHLGNKKATVYDHSFQLTPRGMTLKTNTSLPTWTEMDLELLLPVSTPLAGHANGAQKVELKKIGCRGVVVQCRKQSKSGAYDVAVLFCGLSPRTQQQLKAVSQQLSPPV